MELSFYRMETSGRVFCPFFDHCYGIELDLLKGNFANIYFDQNSVISHIINHEVEAKK